MKKQSPPKTVMHLVGPLPKNLRSTFPKGFLESYSTNTSQRLKRRQSKSDEDTL